MSTDVHPHIGPKVKVDVMSLSSMRKYIQEFHTSDAHIQCIQEISAASVDEINRLKTECANAAHMACITHTDPDCSHATGGVACITSNPIKLTALIPRTANFKEMENGTMKHY